MLRKERNRISISAAGRISRAASPRARGRTRCVCGVRGSARGCAYAAPCTCGSPRRPRTGTDRRCGVHALDGDVAVEQAAAIRSLLFIGKLKDSPTMRVLIHEKSSLVPPGQSLAFSLGDEKGFEWIGAYDITGRASCRDRHRQDREQDRTGANTPRENLNTQHLRVKDIAGSESKFRL